MHVCGLDLRKSSRLYQCVSRIRPARPVTSRLPVFKMPWKGNEWYSDVVLTGKTAVITGGNNGIGKVTAREFYRRGARVIIACRNQETGQKTIEEIKSEPRDTDYHNDIVMKYLDLSDMAIIRKCAEEILEFEQHVHLLICNAGMLGHPDRFTKDGFEAHFAINYLGHFLFTLMLMPTIRKSGPGRIVNVSSLAHSFPFIGNRLDLDDLKFERRSFNNWLAYGQSKLALTMFSKELAERLKEHGIENITTYTIHPGLVRTDIARNYFESMPGVGWLWRGFLQYFYKSPEVGAQSIIYCALEEELEEESGFYYGDRRRQACSSLVDDEELRKRLWTDSLTYVGLADFDPFK